MKTLLLIVLLVFFCPFIRVNAEIPGQQVQNALVPVDSLTFTIDLEDEDGIYLSPRPVSFTVRTDMPVSGGDIRLA